jgi:hypothetical protein
VGPCVLIPYPVCWACWPAPVCGSAKPSVYGSIRSSWNAIRRNYTSWKPSSINHALSLSTPVRPSACVSTEDSECTGTTRLCRRPSSCPNGDSTYSIAPCMIASGGCVFQIVSLRRWIERLGTVGRGHAHWLAEIITQQRPGLLPSLALNHTAKRQHSLAARHIPPHP